MAGRGTSGAEDSFDTDVTAIEKLCTHAMAQIRAVPDPDRAFECATRLVSLGQDIAERGAGERAVAAARIKDARKQTLEALGDMYSMSKQRFGKLVEKGKKLRENPAGED